MTEDVSSLDIDERSGWPDQLRVLLKEYPRGSWRSKPSPIAEFWLDKHDYFRRQCTALKSANDDFRAERGAPEMFGAWIAPRLHGFIAQLHGHHQIEDHHYFPAFRAAEQRLAPGFDALAADHELLHGGIIDIVETVNAFIDTIRDGADSSVDAQRHAGERYIATSEVVFRRLMRHLDDEEDLIIPLMLDRS